MNKRHYEHTLPNIRGSLSNTYVDCDYPQHSIAGMRKRDAEQVGADEDYKRMAYE